MPCLMWGPPQRARPSGVVGPLELAPLARDAAIRRGEDWGFGFAGSGVVGSWTGGVNGAKPGIVMEANPLVGDIYRQEFSIGISEDFGSVIALNQTVTVPMGTYNNCVETYDGSTLEPTTPEHKYFAKGVGNVLGIDVATGQRTELVQIITK